MSRILKTSFFGDENVGLYGFATESYCFIGMQPKHARAMEELLAVRIVTSTLLHTHLASLFVAGNSSGVVLPAIAREYATEASGIRKCFSHSLHLDTPYTALGNLIVMNDNGIVVSPLLRKRRKELADFFSLPAATGTVAGLNVVGSAAVATNRGCLAHPKIRDTEKKVLEETLGVPVLIGTVSFGSPFVKSGIIANSNGMIVSNACSGPEMGRIYETFLGTD